MNGNEFEYFLDNLSLSTLLAKSSFAFLLLSMLFYWFQASFQSNRETESSFAMLNSHNAQCTCFLCQPGSETLEVQGWRLPSSNDSEFKKGNISWMHRLFGKAPSLAMGLANITLALMLLIRWFESGHFPLSNLYESLLFLSWSLTSIHFFLERAFSKGGLLLPTLGAITAPLALFTNAFATFSLPQEMQKISVLVPALQSNWLIMHVSVMMVSYAALLSGSLLAMAFLVVKFFSDSLSVKNVEKLGYKQDEQSSFINYISKPTWSRFIEKLFPFNLTNLRLVHKEDATHAASHALPKVYQGAKDPQPFTPTSGKINSASVFALAPQVQVHSLPCNSEDATQPLHSTPYTPYGVKAQRLGIFDAEHEVSAKRNAPCYTSLEEIVQDDRCTSYQISEFHPKGSICLRNPFSSPLVLNPPNELGFQRQLSCSEPEGGPILSLSAKLASVICLRQPLHPSAAAFQCTFSPIHKVNEITRASLQLRCIERSTRQIEQHQVNGNEKMERHDGQNLLIKNVGFTIPKGEETFEEKLKQTLDNLSYRSIGLGFALLTIGIFSGAVWANEAWGSYWSWDPKETWAFVTWLVFALYLHTRLSRGWIGKESALVATFGFLVIWFCYLGVNLFGKGLHSYGWFPAN